MRNISLGIIIGIIICIIILSFYPIKETEIVCGNCGMKKWYFKIIK